jgi:hypothetical protein
VRVRIAQSAHVQDFQLRFRAGIGYAFDDRLRGWNRRDDDACELTLTEQDVEELLSHPVMSVPISERNDIEEKAALAMGWMERACLTGDDLIAMLYRFFALEALLGDKSEGLKAHGLAFREMVLSHLIEGGFRHPNATFFYYDQIRSVAVHGGQPPDVPRNVTARFEWAVRDALRNYFALARQQGFSGTVEPGTASAGIARPSIGSRDGSGVMHPGCPPVCLAHPGQRCKGHRQGQQATRSD